MSAGDRAALVAQIKEHISAANRLMPIAQQRRFPGFRHPPMLFHWDADWDDTPTADLLDVCAWITGIIERLEKVAATTDGDYMASVSMRMP